MNMTRRYCRIPKNIRFDQFLLDDCKKYQRMTGITFSDLVRVSLGNYLSHKLHRQ